MQVHYVPGGVARNIAECMSKLGTKPYMISALGLDMAGVLYLFIKSLCQLSNFYRRHHTFNYLVTSHGSLTGWDDSTILWVLA